MTPLLITIYLPSFPFRMTGMSNLLTAISNVVNNPVTQIKERYTTSTRNRINSVGDALEQYVQDVFSGSFDSEEEDRNKKVASTFSYLGNSNNPPDGILRKGDAIEVKKVQNPNSAIALNSSYPKAKLFSDSTLIANKARTCEKWSEKDIVYIIGHTNDSDLKYLWFVYGDCFCAEKNTYERIKNTISPGVNDIHGIEFTETNELGKVKKVDPLGITGLRIRGMWHIANPHKIFSYLYKKDAKAKFQLFCLMKSDKFDSFPEHDKKALTSMKKDGYTIESKKIKDPNNPAVLLNCKLITYKTY